MANQVTVGQQDRHSMVEQQGVQPPAEQQGMQEAAPAVEPAPAVWGPAEMQKAIFDAVREELDDEELTDDEIAEGFRYTDKIIVQGPDGRALLEFEVGKSYPGLEASWIVGIFTLPVEDSVPGDLRIYVAVPTLPVAGVADHLCYVFNRATMTTRREKMTRALFVEEVAAEDARLFEPDEDEEDDEELEEEGPVCAEETCEEPVAHMCVCQVCMKLESEDRFHACANHRGEVGMMHVKEAGRTTVWQKLPVVPASVSGTA